MRGTLLLLLLLTSGCASSDVKPWAYEDNREMAARPGLFSGDPGGFTVWRR